MYIKRIYHYLTENNLISPNQFGFQAGHSTNHAIISLTEYIREKLDAGNYVCGIQVSGRLNAPHFSNAPISFPKCVL